MSTPTLRRALLPATLACAVLASACGAANEQASGGSGAGGQNLSGDIKGGGASTQKVAQDAWIAKFTWKNPKVSMSYNPIGSGGGRKRFISGAFAYAGSDVALQGKELDRARQRCGGQDKLVEIPVYLSPIAVTYHLKGVQNLKLTPEVIAKIFTGKIARWNDPAIAKTNPGVRLPNQRITPVHRSDESGTTGNFTDYLAGAAGKAWSFGMTQKWPSALKGESAQGTSGVVKVVDQTPGSITYADASQVRDNKQLAVAKVKVGSEFVGPTAKAAAKILADSKQTDTPGKYVMTYHLNRKTSASGTYPIVLASYEMACTTYQQPSTAEAVQAYLRYVTGEQGQQLAAKQAGSAPLTSALRKKLQPAVNAIKG